MLDDIGLSASIKWLAHIKLENSLGIKVIFLTNDNKFTHSFCCKEVETNIYRIVQEAITNICKHSKATIVKIIMLYSNDSLKLRISDNGIGFNMLSEKESNETKCFGLLGMQERASLINAKLRIASKKHKGTTISLII